MLPASRVAVCEPPATDDGRVKLSVSASTMVTAVAATPSTFKSAACTDVNKRASLKSTVISVGGVFKDAPLAGVVALTWKAGGVLVAPLTLTTYSPLVEVAVVE